MTTALAGLGNESWHRFVTTHCTVSVPGQTPTVGPERLETVAHPDTPHRRRKHERPEAADPTAHQPRSAPYVELHAHSAYSFLDGASQPEELATAAAELGHTALALTDHDGVYGS
ncbi:MAG TPA: PHP domain-containing protein, partial [Gaiellaceae bacterium]